ncbi:uncharacterized protein [Heterodontus francisci]|uniref:uncharacterized protein n=1 Tax=Heterodontus francisci TaxID=7792 RepID=UPI00355B3AF8
MNSQVRQNYHKDSEDAVNKQINLELYSSYVYLSMSYYFDRDDVALRHFAEFFKEQSHEEREHAEKLLKFQNKRGGRIILEDVKKPEQDEWSNGLEAMQRALQMEKDVNQSLLDLHKLSTGNTDPHVSSNVFVFLLAEGSIEILKVRMASQVCQNYHKDCEDAVNKQINLELYSSYVYLSMSFYFDQDDVALRHFAEFFKEQSHEEREHAEKLMKFQNKREGRIILEDIKKPEQDEWSNGLEAMQRALQMEKDVNQSLLDLHKLSTGNTDPHVSFCSFNALEISSCDFLESHYLDEQVKMIKKLGDHITNLKRLGPPENGMGEYLFDKHMLGEVITGHLESQNAIHQNQHGFMKSKSCLNNLLEFIEDVTKSSFVQGFFQKLGVKTTGANNQFALDTLKQHMGYDHSLSPSATCAKMAVHSHSAGTLRRTLGHTQHGGRTPPSSSLPNMADATQVDQSGAAELAARAPTGARRGRCQTRVPAVVREPMGSLCGLLPGLLVGLQPARGLLHCLKCRPGSVRCGSAAGRHLQLARGSHSQRGGQGRGPSQSQGRLNYPRECEEAINSQINQELTASYVYLSMSYYFDRDDVALRNFARFYMEQSVEEQKHADKLMKFQNQRGGRIVLWDIKKPKQDEWGNGLEAMECALQLEKDVNQRLLDLHKLATEHNDPSLCDFLESNYLNEQVEAIKKLGDHITNLKRLGAPDNGMGEYLFDKHTLGEGS